MLICRQPHTNTARKVYTQTATFRQSWKGLQMDSQILTARQVYTQTAAYRYSHTGLHTESHTQTEQDWFTHRTAGPASIGHPSAG